MEKSIIFSEKSARTAHGILTVFNEYLIIWYILLSLEAVMEVRDIRKKTGLTQRAFAELYHIPLQTLKEWESSTGSSSYRRPPDYVTYMLGCLVGRDFNASLLPPDRCENLVHAAQHSRGCARQWLRYLRKEFDNHTLRLNDGQIRKLLASDQLSMAQKVIFKRAIQAGTATNEYVIGLNEKAATPMVDKLLGRRQ